MSYLGTMKKVCYAVFIITLTIFAVFAITDSLGRKYIRGDPDKWMKIMDIHNTAIDLAIVFGLISVILLVFFLYFSKMSLTVTNKRIYGQTAFGKRVDLPLDMISAVGTSAFKGIAVATSSGKIKFLGISNQEEVHKAITDLLLERQNNPKPTTQIKQEIPQSNADELKKYKELLDSGIITQEEFDAKKKQLLGL